MREFILDNIEDSERDNFRSIPLYDGAYVSHTVSSLHLKLVERFNEKQKHLKFVKKEITMPEDSVLKVSMFNRYRNILQL